MTTEWVLSEKWGLPLTLLEMLDPAIANIVYNHMDAVFVCTGRERMGKSTLAMRMADYCAWKMSKYLGDNPDLHFNPQNICLTAEKYVHSIRMASKFNIFIYDEAITGWYSRRSMSTSNVVLNTALMTCGNKQGIHFVCIPNFFALDRDVRYRRVLAIFNVYGIPRLSYLPNGMHSWEVEKGYFDLFTADDVPKIQIDKEVVKWPRSPWNYMRFTGYEDENQQWAKYNSDSATYKDQILEKGEKDLKQTGKRRAKQDAKDEFEEKP